MKPYLIEVVLHAENDRDAVLCMEEIAFLVANRMRRQTSERYLVYRASEAGERGWQPIPEEAYGLTEEDVSA